MNITCIICSDIMVPSEEIFSTKCGHLFHYVCLLQWIERASTCPQCRHKTSQTSIHRVYFTLSNTDHIGDDVGMLQSKLDNQQFQMTLKDKDLKEYKEKYKKYQIQNAALRLEVSEVEGRLKSHESVVHGLRDRITFYKSKATESERLVDENQILKKKIRSLESVQAAVNGTREEANEAFRNESNRESLLIMCMTLKRTLVEAQKTKSALEHKYKSVQNELTKHRREVASLQAVNKELNRNFQKSKNNWEEEKTNLTSMFLEAQSKKTKEDLATVKRIILESPAPVPRKPRPSSEVINIETPPVEKQVSKILESDSPYLPVKSNASGLPQLQFSKVTKQLQKRGCIFRGALNSFDEISSLTKGDEVACDGLGGQSKDESPFPSSNRDKFKYKRSRICSSLSSSKIRKLTPYLDMGSTRKPGK